MNIKLTLMSDHYQLLINLHNTMGLFRMMVGFLKSYSVPVFKSFFRAYKDTTAGAQNSQQSGSSKKHPMDQMFKSVLSKTNLSAPPLDAATALKILNIEQKQKQLDPKVVLDRYYTLFKKNDPAIGGTAYLQSKIFAAKETVMTQFPNAAEVEQQFYKDVVEPELKAEEERKQKEKEEEEKKKQVGKEEQKK